MHRPQGQVARRPPIHRVRTGCLTCRGRKKKCDERKPKCSGCTRNNLECHWPTTVQRGVNKSKQQARHQSALKESDSYKTSAPHEAAQPASFRSRPGPEPAVSPSNCSNASTYDSVSSSSPRPPQHTIGLRVAMTEVVDIPPSPESDRASLLGSPSPPNQIVNSDPLQSSYLAGLDNHATPDEDALFAADTYEDAEEVDSGTGGWQLTANATDPIQSDFHLMRMGSQSISRNLSLFSGLEGRSFELLGHYLSRTALSMGNGSTDVNPFIAQLIPLTFVNDLILQLVLTQSSAHRAISDGGSKSVAQTDYTKSIRLFRAAIDDYVHGREASPLWVTVGALIMCFTETTKGDVNGVIFNHLNATGPLLADLIVRPPCGIGAELKAFIVEYYMYTALISMISLDPEFGTIPFFRPELELEAHQMANTGYVGQLCGCWLPLLLLIPSIFALGRRSVADDVDPAFPSADDFLNFSTVQSQILAFTPATPPDSEVTLCGYIFQQSIHLYLLTVLEAPCKAKDAHKMAIESSIDQAFSWLDSLSSTARINTSLCWALAVIGSCITDELRRDELRQRLNLMFFTIGLGNIRATLELLERMWVLPDHQLSPWKISQVMQENQMWISFA